jgi:uncharacterized protein YecE (DUF72 family)
MSVYIGTSGWSYDHWHGVLYPHGIPARDRLGYYVQRYGTAELNSSYYRWPRDPAFRHWHRRVPTGFRLSVKAPGMLTHVQRLYAPERWLLRMRKSLGLLGEKFGVLLVQLSPNFSYDYLRLAYFLGQMPPGLRVAVEFRHPSWHQEAVFALLERHDPQHLYGGSYSDRDLCWWADRIREWTAMGRDVFLYFKNDGEGNAVRNADQLRGLLG